jgi:ribosomal protein S19
MSHVFPNKINVFKKDKIKYFSYKVWRSMYLITSNPIHSNSEKRLRTRSSTIPTTYIYSEILVHSGKRWHLKRINPWLVGFKVGEFTWNRRLALYKAKQLRKKAKKAKNKK